MGSGIQENIQIHIGLKSHIATMASGIPSIGICHQPARFGHGSRQIWPWIQADMAIDPSRFGHGSG